MRRLVTEIEGVLGHGDILRHLASCLPSHSRGWSYARWRHRGSGDRSKARFVRWKSRAFGPMGLPGSKGRSPIQRVLYAVAFVLFSFNPVLAEVRIKASSGGEVTQFVELFALLRQTDERIVIDGPCYSACTLVLSIIPRSRICVTRRAVLGFHAAKWVNRNGEEFSATEETRVVAATYPAQIRSWIRRHGGLTDRTLYLHGRELTAIYPLCR